MGQPVEPLTVRVYSFSYHSSGIPADAEGHGGGFVFDCRCLPNPHRDPELRPYPGDASPVVAYLEAQPEVVAFVDHAAALVRQAAHQYTDAGRSRLMVACGCTGGRHRSVYVATRLAAALEEAGFAVALTHLDRDRATEEIAEARGQA